MAFYKKTYARKTGYASRRSSPFPKYNAFGYKRNGAYGYQRRPGQPSGYRSRYPSVRYSRGNTYVRRYSGASGGRLTAQGNLQKVIFKTVNTVGCSYVSVDEADVCRDVEEATVPSVEKNTSTQDNRSYDALSSPVLGRFRLFSTKM